MPEPADLKQRPPFNWRYATYFLLAGLIGAGIGGLATFGTLRVLAASSRPLLDASLCPTDAIPIPTADPVLCANASPACGVAILNSANECKVAQLSSGTCTCYDGQVTPCELGDASAPCIGTACGVKRCRPNHYGIKQWEPTCHPVDWSGP